MRCACRSEPNCRAIFPRSNAKSFSVRTKVPGDFLQFECEAQLGQNQNSWRFFPVLMRGVCRAEPKFLAVITSENARCLSVRTEIPCFFSSLNAGRFSARTRIPGDLPQYKCETFFGRNRNSWRYLPVWARGVFRRETNFLAIVTSLDARRFSVRTKLPGGIARCK